MGFAQIHSNRDSLELMPVYSPSGKCTRAKKRTPQKELPVWEYTRSETALQYRLLIHYKW